jgi:putative peptidoglycan lipid II flippase
MRAKQGFLVLKDGRCSCRRYSEAMKLLKAMATVGGLTGLSRIAGFVRDILTASILGAGPIADAFFVALKLPNFFRRVTAEGAFSVAFVPLYSGMSETEGRQKADAFASNAFMMMMAILSVVTFLALAFMPYIIMAIAPGFETGGERATLAVELSRITFPYLLFMSLTALLGGVLNALGRFAPFAFAPVLFNLCLIGGLLLSGHFETAGHALSYGIAAAGVLQLVWLLVCARRAKFSLKIGLPKFDANIKETFKLMGPGVIGAGVMHINLFADLVIASFLGAGSISYLYYADRLNQLPLGVVGIAVGTALLPMLSKSMAREQLKGGDKDESRALFNKALEVCLLLALPAAAALAVIPNALITVLFERGAFTPEDTAVTVSVLMAYAVGLPAYICIKVFSTAHWARKDTMTPVKISVFATVLNIALSLVLIQFIGVVGIALATGLTGWLQFALHMRALRDHPSVTFELEFLRRVIKIVIASALMAAGLYINAHVFNRWEGESGLMQIVELGILVVGGMLMYGFALMMLGVANLSDLKQNLKRS